MTSPTITIGEVSHLCTDQGMDQVYGLISNRTGREGNIAWVLNKKFSSDIEHCPHCGVKLPENLKDSFVFDCPRDESCACYQYGKEVGANHDRT